MKPSHYTVKKDFRIFALINDENCTYVGKTTCRRLSAIYSAHINGRYTATRGYYAKTGPDRPEIYVLEQQSMTGAEAYKHLVAWVHVMAKEGYWCLNADGILENARSLHPETSKIVEAITQEPLQDILLWSQLDTPYDADIAAKPASEPVEESPAKAKLSIRLTADDKDQFVRFAAELNMNQRQAFSYLLHRAMQSQEDILERQIINSVCKSYKQDILTLQEHNAQLQQTIHALKEEKANDKLRARRNLCMAQAMVRIYLQHCPPPIQTGLPLREFSYKQYKARFPDAEKYEYPEPGQYLMRLEAIVWGKGKGPVYFLIGTSLDCKKYKFRVYSRDSYIGLEVHQSPYATYRSVWLLGGQLAKDGAVDLVASLPITESVAEAAKVQTRSDSRKPPLTEVLHSIQIRNKKA